MDELNEILKKIATKDFENIFREIEKTKEYRILAKKTQIKNSVVENGNNFYKKLTTRQIHTTQVAQVAYTMVKESGMSEKEALVAKLVGLCHDLGHTPFGHDGENFFEEKTGKQFSHAKYGAKILDKIFKEILSSKNNKTGKELFDKETKVNFEQLRNYIKAGVNFHSDCYYMFKLEKQLNEFEKKYNEEELAQNTKYILLKNAIKNPCVQAGMLADTVAFMQSDVRDLLTVENPFDSSKTVISIDDQVKVAKEIGFTPESIKTMKDQLFSVGKVVDTDGLSTEEALKKVLETIESTNIVQIQTLMATNIGRQGLKEVKFESIPDEYKLLLDDNEAGYKELIEFKPKKTYINDWKTFRDKELAKQREALMMKNPLLCLTYEIQNELMYGKILSPENIKILNNDVERNKAIFSRVYDYLYEITDKPASELRVEDLEIRKQMLQLWKDGNYPKQFKEKGQNSLTNRKAIITNLVIYKMQQMGNEELKEFYQERLASKEKSLEIEIDTLEQEGKSDDEIVNVLQGIDVQSYESFKQKDEQTREKVAIFQTKTKQEIAPEFNVEKRDIDEIQAGKSILNRNLEYNMTYKEIEQVVENSGKSELEEKSDMASYIWSSNMNEGEEFEVDMEMLVRNALAYIEINAETVTQMENVEQKMRDKNKVIEGVSQR